MIAAPDETGEADADIADRCPREIVRNDRPVRQAAVAGQFYPREAADCRLLAERFLINVPAAEAIESPRWIGGIVPHAGWICSGAVAGRTIAAIRQAGGGGSEPDIVVIFGAVHTPLAIYQAALDSFGRWASPLGETQTAGEIGDRLREKHEQLFTLDDRFHAYEHAVEVELPLIQVAWPRARILPIEVPAIDAAIEIGRLTAQEVSGAGLKAIYLASSDLTHYGPMYGFAPAGVGLAALQWAKENDWRLLRAVTDFSYERIVPEVRDHLNACGPGAIAAAMSACRELGASTARVLQHANSYETLADVHPQSPYNAVGYAAAVFG